MPGPSDIKAGRAFVEAYLDKTQLQRGLKAVSADFKAFGGGISSLGKKFMVLGTGIVTPLLAATKHFMAVGDQLDKMAARTGMSTNALSELGFAAEMSGSSLEEVENGVRRMQKAIESGTVPALAKLKGLSPEEQFMAVADSLNAISDPTQRAAKAMEVFGKTGTGLLPMLGDVKALREEAVRLGLSIGPEQAKAAADLDDAWTRVTRSFGAVAVAIGSALAPVLTGLAGIVKDGIGAVAGWVAAHKGLVVGIFAAGAAAIAGGVGLLLLGKAVSLTGMMFSGLLMVIKGAMATFSFMSSAVMLLANPFVLVGVAAVALGGYLLYASGAAGKAADWIMGVLGELMDEVSSTFGVIAQAMAAGDFTSAAKVGWALVKLEWQKGVAFISGLWEDFKGLYDEAVTGIAIAWVNLSAKIQTIWAELLNWISKKWEAWSNSSLTEGFADMIAPIVAWFSGVATEDVRKNLKQDFAYKRSQQANNFATSDAATAKRKKEIEDERAAAVAGLGTDLAGRDAKRKAAAAAAQAEVDAARNEWENAKTDATAKIAKSSAERKGPGGLPPEMDLLSGGPKSTVRGTFSASAVAGLAVGGAQERTAKATEGIHRIAQKQLAEQKRLSLEAEA